LKIKEDKLFILIYKYTEVLFSLDKNNLLQND